MTDAAIQAFYSAGFSLSLDMAVFWNNFIVSRIIIGADVIDLKQLELIHQFLPCARISPPELNTMHFAAITVVGYPDPAFVLFF